jgi:hypothetical protein
LLETSDLGGVPGGLRGGDAATIGVEQGDQAERVADPALAGAE